VVQIKAIEKEDLVMAGAAFGDGRCFGDNNP